VELDISQPNDWQRAVDIAESKFGKLTTLVNNAGIVGVVAPITELPIEDFRRVIDINLVSQFVGIQTAAPRIARSGGGSIVNVSSINGFVAGPGVASYVSSKFGVRGLTRVAAIELAPQGIRVNAVVPGPIDTPMVHPDALGGPDIRPQLAEMTALGRMGQPNEVAQLVVWLASPLSSFCTGADFVVDGGTLAGRPLKPQASPG